MSPDRPIVAIIIELKERQTMNAIEANVNAIEANVARVEEEGRDVGKEHLRNARIEFS